MVRATGILFLLFFTFISAAQPKSGVNYMAILKRAATYSKQTNDSLPPFTYQSSNHPALVELRKRFNLDSIAGFGTEASRLINLLHWVHNTVRHDGQHASGIKEINAFAIVTAAKKRKKWVWMNPTNDAYIMNERGDLLSMESPIFRRKILLPGCLHGQKPLPVLLPIKERA